MRVGYLGRGLSGMKPNQNLLRGQQEKGQLSPLGTKTL